MHDLAFAAVAPIAPAVAEELHGSTGPNAGAQFLSVKHNGLLLQGILLDWGGLPKPRAQVRFLSGASLFACLLTIIVVGGDNVGHLPQPIISSVTGR